MIEMKGVLFVLFDVCIGWCCVIFVVCEVLLVNIVGLIVVLVVEVIGFLMGSSV